MKKTLLFLSLILIAIAPGLVGIFHPGFFVSDDGNWMVIRLSAFYEAFRHGQFPVRFLPRLNNGFGYPVADFLYPLFLYLGSFIHILHIPFVLTIKILFGFSLVGGAIGIFFWLKKSFGNLGAFIGSIVYTLFPYHLWDITKRGSLGEVLAMGIVPYIFWQIEESNFILSGLGIGLLILSHNTLALLFLPIIIIYTALLKKYKEVIFTTFLGLGISAFFWLPALYDKQYTVFDTTVVSQFSQYFLSNTLYSLIGIISFVILSLSLYLYFKKQDLKPAFFLIVSFISIALTTSVTTIFWKILPLGKYVQFPFRFLSVSALGVAFLSAFCIYRWKKEQQILFSGIILILVYFSSFNYLSPKMYQFFPDTFYSTNQDTTTVQNEYMPKWVKHLPLSTQKINISSGELKNVVNNVNSLAFQTVSTSSSVVTISTIYFPGWQAKIDGNTVPIIPAKNSGFITFSVISGTHNIIVSFTETIVRLIADIISVISLIVICIFWYKRKYGNFS